MPLLASWLLSYKWKQRNTKETTMGALDLYNGNGRGIQITPKQEALCKALNTFNALRDFKLNDIEILEWMDAIDRLVKPEPDALQFAIDMMMKGEIPYEKNKGIKNIFDALQLIDKTENGFKVKQTLKPW